MKLKYTSSVENIFCLLQKTEFVIAGFKLNYEMKYLVNRALGFYYR